MSTGQQHHIEHDAHSFEAINAHINNIDLAEITSMTAVPQTGSGRAQRLTITYRAARPILAALAATPFIPATWRAIVRALVVSLDQVTASFKAGKDLAVGDDVSVSTMEPKLPAA